MLATLTTALRDLGIPGLVGVLIGWGLNHLSAARARRDQRAWEEEALLRKQQRDAAAELDEALADGAAAADLPTGGEPLSFSAVAEAFTEFRRVWNRYEPRIYDEELHDHLAGTAELFRLAARRARTDDASSTELAMAAELALTNGRYAIAAVLHDRDPEPPVFPSEFWSAEPEASDDPVRYVTQWFDEHATDSPTLVVRYMIVHGDLPAGVESEQDEPPS